MQRKESNLSIELLLASRAVYLLFPPDRLPCNSSPAILVIVTNDRHYKIARIGLKEYTIQTALHEIKEENGQIFTLDETTKLETLTLSEVIQFILKKVKKPIHKIFISTGLIDSDQFHKYSEFACIYYCDNDYCKDGCKYSATDEQNESSGRQEYFTSAESERMIYKK